MAKKNTPKKAQRGSARTQKNKSISNRLRVKKYPLDNDKNETQVLGETQWVRVSALFAPRIETIVGIRPELFVRYRWQPDAVGMARFNRNVHKFLVDKAGFTLDELRGLTFMQLCSELEPYIKQRDETLNERWQDELHDVYEIGLRYLDYWRSRIKEAVAIVEKYISNLRSGEPVKPPFPYMKSKPGICDDRLPTRDDLPWMYFVVGMKIEGIFCLDDTFVPADTMLWLSNLSADFDESVWQIVDGETSPNHFKPWIEFIRRDLQNINSAVGSDMNGQTKPAEAGGKAGETQNFEGNWSKPMSKAAIMLKLGMGLRGYQKLNTFTKEHPIRKVANSRQLWYIRIDKMPKNLRDKFK